MADEAQQAQQEMARGQTNWGTGGGRKAGVADPESAAQEADVMEEEEGEAMHDEEGREGEDVDEGVEQDCREAGDSFVAAKLAATRLEDDMEEGEGELREVRPPAQYEARLGSNLSVTRLLTITEEVSLWCAAGVAGACPRAGQGA